MIGYLDLGISEEEYENHISPLLKELFLKGQFVFSKQVEEFEEKFALYCGTKYAVAVNSGTDALIFALSSLGIKQGDEVITVSNSFVATANAVKYVGAEPIFVDIGADLLMDSTKIESFITEKTKAIIPVHLMGLSCNMDSINEIAKKYNLYVIEDAAQSVGSLYKNKKTGSLGHLGCFSFHPTKNLGGITDGGMVTTNDSKIVDYIKEIRNHGLQDRDIQNSIGRVSRLNSLNAVILNYRLLKIEEILQQRIKNAQEYNALLQSVPCVEIINVLKELKHTYHTYIIKVKYRDELQEFLFKNGIETRIHYPISIHKQKPYINQSWNLPLTELYAQQILTLPIANVNLNEIKVICNLIKQFYLEKV